ncbi:MAG: hypothetical protein KU37_05905 [Sulfuricurvum sp. PC08-66]|nr:MAG: hypothetical protein KU37_05905 [Sulfuricurvum sp. PC08-66]
MCNVGALDKVIRFFAGVIAVIAAFFVGTLVSLTAGFIVGAVGVVMMGTAIFGFCPLYPILRINTCKK